MGVALLFAMKNKWMCALIGMAICAGCGDDSSSNTAAPNPGGAVPVQTSTLRDPAGLPALAGVSADFDGDGVADLAVLTASAITVFRGPIAVGSTGDRIDSYLLPPTASDLAVSDLNGDGVADLVVGIRSDQTTPGRVHIILRTAGGAILFENEIFSGFDTTDVLAADVNGDGLRDIIASDGANTLIAIGTGSGGFGPPSPILDAAFPAVGDFNNDGSQEIAAVNALDATRVDIHKWDPGFNEPMLAGSVPVAAPVVSLAAADLNGDGQTDLVVGMNGGIQALFGGGNFSFTPQQQVASGTIAYVAVGDFNADGRPDIAYAAPSYVVTLMASTAGGYEAGRMYAYSTPLAGLSATDVDNDGASEIITASASVTVYYPSR